MKVLQLAVWLRHACSDEKQCEDQEMKALHPGILTCNIKQVYVSEILKIFGSKYGCQFCHAFCCRLFYTNQVLYLIHLRNFFVNDKPGR